MNQTIHNLLTEQLASWETARNNYAALSGVRVKELNVNGIPYKVQFNPARIVSSGTEMFSVPGKPAAGTERHPVQRTLQHPGESVPHLPPPPDNTGTGAYAPTHRFPLHRHAGAGRGADGIYHLLQRSQVWCLCPRPCPFPGRKQGIHAHREGLARTDCRENSRL